MYHYSACHTNRFEKSWELMGFAFLDKNICGVSSHTIDVWNKSSMANGGNFPRYEPEGCSTHMWMVGLQLPIPISSGGYKSPNTHMNNCSLPFCKKRQKCAHIPEAKVNHQKSWTGYNCSLCNLEVWSIMARIDSTVRSFLILWDSHCIVGRPITLFWNDWGQKFNYRCCWDMYEGHLSV